MRNKLLPDHSDPYFYEVEDIHDAVCTPHCNLGITWAWYEDIVNLIKAGWSREEIIDVYRNEAA